MIQVDVQGTDEVHRRLETVVRQMLTGAPQALYAEGNRIMGESVTLVPVDTGNLRSTAHVEQPQIQAGEIVVELRYGSHGQAVYATIVHENTALNHPNGGQSHFLSQPLFAATAGMAQRLADDIRSQMGG